jgi:hypothetical protein
MAVGAQSSSSFTDGIRTETVPGLPMQVLDRMYVHVQLVHSSFGNDEAVTWFALCGRR